MSVEHQLRGLSVGETMEQDVYETVKEAANFLYQQYLSQEVKFAVCFSFVSSLLTFFFFPWVAHFKEEK